MGTHVRCSVSVEVKGRMLHTDKSAKLFGLEVGEPNGRSPPLRVLGFKREIRLAPRDIRQIHDSHVAAGRLALVAQDGMKVMLSKAQPTQLQLVLRSLRGRPQEGTTMCSGGLGAPHGLGLTRSQTGTVTEDARRHSRCQKPQSVAGDWESADTLAPRMVATPSKVPRTVAQDVGSCATADTLSACEDRMRPVTLADFPTNVLDEIISYDPSAAAWARLAESCKRLEAFADEGKTAFHIGRTRRAYVCPSMVVDRIARRSNLSALNLSGYAELTAGETARLAMALKRPGAGLRTLVLRGCKGLGDVSVQRLVASCPMLEVLDILEIPALGNRALEAPMRALRILAAGSLGRLCVSEGLSRRPSSAVRTSTVTSSLPAAPVGQLAQVNSKGSAQFTTTLLTRLGRPPPEVGPLPLRGELGGAPLTHLVLAHCCDIEVLPRLPATLCHLDLRGANLQGPHHLQSNGQTWRPLANCSQLNTLCLAGNGLLSSPVLSAILSSLPMKGQLRTLDISSTQADANLFAALPSLQEALTRLRAASCMRLTDHCFTAVLLGLRELEVLDVTGCRGLLGFPTDLALPAPAAAVGPEPGPMASLRLLGVGQTELAGMHLESTRRALAAVAPTAHAVPGNLDVFNSYGALPPVLL